MAQDTVEATALKNRILNVKIPPQHHPSPHILEFIFVDANLGFGFGGLAAVASGQVAREDLTTIKAKAPSLKHTQKRRIAASTPPTTIFPLNTPLGNGLGLTSLSKEEPQDPSPMDNNLELDAIFPLDMVVVMQEGAPRKAHKMVIGQTINGRLMIKVLNNCLKLHLPTSFVSTTLLTHCFFDVLFSDEERTKATRKITSVEWSDMNFFFFMYVSNFDSNAQGAEAMFTHTVKVQFPDLHEQFRNKKALTIMTSKIGKVLEIELVESYVKRLDDDGGDPRHQQTCRPHSHSFNGEEHNSKGHNFAKNHVFRST
jgi:hypothetical protein